MSTHVSSEMARSRLLRSPKWIAGLVTLLACALTVLACTGLWHAQEARQQSRFETEAHRIEQELEHRFSLPVQSLRGVLGTLLARGDLDRAAFSRHVQAYKLKEDFPGVLGIGLIEPLQREHIPGYEAARQADGTPSFRVQTDGERRDLWVVRYLEPTQDNQGALGLDLSGDERRRRGVQQAVDTGLPVLSEALQLRQDPQKRAGFLLLIAAYRPGAPTETVEQRRAALMGLVYAPIVLETLMATGRPSLLDASLHVRISTEQGDTSPLYEAGLAPAEARPPYVRKLNLPGQQLGLRIDSTARFEELIDHSLTLVLGGVGLAFSMMLGLSIWLLSSSRVRALALAQTLSLQVQQLARVAERTTSGVLMTDKDWRITWANDGFTRIMGYQNDEVLGCEPHKFVGPPDQTPAELQDLLTAVHHEQACRVTLPNLTRDQRIRWIDTEVQPLRDNQGELSGFMLIGLDVTDEREAQMRWRTMVDLVQQQQKELDLLAQVTRVTRDAVALIQKDGTVQWANNSFLQLVERSSAEVVGTKLPEVLCPEPSEPGMPGQLQTAIEMHVSSQFTLALRQQSGSPCWVELELKTFPPTTALEPPMMLVARDITATHIATHRLQVALRDHERLIQAVRVACIYSVTDASGTIIDVNDGFLKSSGYALNEILGLSHKILSSSHHRTDFWRDVWREISSGRIWHGEICNRTRSGAPYWLDTTIVPFMGDDGRPEKYIAIRHEITRIKTAQLELEAQKARLSNILKGTNAGTWAWHLPSGAITFNERWAKICGYQLEDLPSPSIDTWIAWVHPFDQEALHRAFTQHTTGLSDYFNVEVRARHRDGHWVWVLDRGQLGSPEEGHPAQWMYGTRQDISRRKEAEVALRASESRSKLLSGLSAEWFWELDKDLRFIRFSGGSTGLLQDLDLRALGRQRWELGGEPLVGSWEDHRATLQRRERFKDFEYRIPQPDGQDLFWSVSGEPLFNELGLFTGYIGIGSDITRRKLDQHQLLVSEARLERTARMAGVGAWRIDLLTHEVIWSAQTCEIHGVAPDHQPSLTEALDGYSADSPSLRHTFQSFLNGESTHAPQWDLECSLLSARGETLWVREAGEVEFRDGVPVALVGAVRDVTLRRRQEDELRAKEARLRAIYRVLPLGIAITDPRGLLVDYNPAFEHFFHLRGDAGHNPKALLELDRLHNESGEPIAKMHLPWFHALAESTPVRDAVFEHRGATPKRWFSVDAMPVAHHEFGVVVAFTDVTLLKSQADALRSAKEQAEQASLFKSQFLANMSHEIRTPIHAVTGMLTLLSRTALQARQVDYVSKASGAARSLLSLINDILDFSKIEAGKMTLDPQPFELEQLWRDLSVILSVHAANNPLELLFDLDPALPATLMGDGLRLKQVLLNLGSNAVKFTPHGEVIIRVRPLQRVAPPDTDDLKVWLQFEVEDTGIGIAPENQERIFSGFIQAEASTTRRFGGTGLGLSISRHLIELMGGQLQLHSTLGQGSLFSFELPFDRPLLPQQPPPIPGTPAPAKTVLVVDKHALSRKSLCKMAAQLGWKAQAASSAQTAIQALQAIHSDDGNRPDDRVELILLSPELPDEDGWQLADQIRRLPGLNQTTRSGVRRPVILMVASAGRELLEQQSPEVRALIDGYLVKPITARQIQEAWELTAQVQFDAHARREMATQRPLTDLRLLVVEDNAINQQVAEELLSAQGASVDLAENGQRGLEAVLSAHRSPHPYDAVLMDMQMPVMDGLESARQIRLHIGSEELPIIAMTANAMAGDREICLAVGMNDHIGKPFALDDLLHKLLYWTGTTRTNESVHAEPGQTLETNTGETEALPLLDVKAALARMGHSKSLYERMAMNLQNTLPDLLRGLIQAPHPTSNDASKLAAYQGPSLHTLKGVAATLGALRLADTAGHFEAAAKRGICVSPENLERLERLASESMRALFDHLTRDTERSTPPESTDPKSGLSHRQREALENLLIQLEASDIEAFDLLEQLATSEPQLALFWRSLESALDTMDFAEAARLTKQKLGRPIGLHPL